MNTMWFLFGLAFVIAIMSGLSVPNKRKLLLKRLVENYKNFILGCLKQKCL